MKNFVKLNGYNIILTWIDTTTPTLNEEQKKKLRKFIDNGKFRNLATIYLTSERVTGAGVFIDNCRNAFKNRGVEMALNFMPHNITFKNLKSNKKYYEQAFELRTGHFTSFTKREIWSFDPYPMFSNIFGDENDVNVLKQIFYENMRMTLKSRFQAIRPKKIFPPKEPETVDFDPMLAGSSTSPDKPDRPTKVSPSSKRKKRHDDTESDDDMSPEKSKAKGDALQQLTETLAAQIAQSNQHHLEFREDIKSMANCAYQIAGNANVHLVDNRTSNIHQQHNETKQVHVHTKQPATPGTNVPPGTVGFNPNLSSIGNGSIGGGSRDGPVMSLTQRKNVGNN